MRSNTTEHRTGFVLVLVVLIASLLLIMGLTFWGTNQSDSRQVVKNVRFVQAQFLAKGALQIALLKARLCPTPLYDAVAYSVGKNPYYLHTKGYDHLEDAVGATPNPTSTIIPGPAFLTGDVAFGPGGELLRSNEKAIPGGDGDRVAQDMNPFDGLTGEDWKVDQYLNYFIQDLKDVSLGGQPMVSVSSSTPCPILGDTDPISGKFQIEGMMVAAPRGNRQYGAEALKVVAVATIRSRIAGVEEEWTTRERTTYLVRRQY